MPRQHVWTERDAAGSRREVRATWFARAWRLQSKSGDEERWTYHDPPLRNDLIALKQLVERKYRRRRATLDELSAIERLLQEQNFE